MLENLVSQEELQTRKSASEMEEMGVAMKVSEWLQNEFGLADEYPTDVYDNMSGCREDSVDNGYRFDLHEHYYVFDNREMFIGALRIGVNNNVYAEIWKDANHILGYVEL